VREPKRTSLDGGILDIDERTGRAVTRIIGGRHSTMAAEELEPVGDLDGRQIFCQGSASHGFKMGKTPRRDIFKYVKEMFCTHDAPLSSPRADTGERAFYGRLKFQESVLNVESFALRLFGMLIAQGCCESRVFLKRMSCPGTGRGGPSQQERYPVGRGSNMGVRCPKSDDLGGGSLAEPQKTAGVTGRPVKTAS
jgi:hypothetical protein